MTTFSEAHGLARSRVRVPGPVLVLALGRAHWRGGRECSPPRTLRHSMSRRCSTLALLRHRHTTRMPGDRPHSGLDTPAVTGTQR
eukprot:scaffold827_cov369-Prasinococcus_capsulatus_cf.AAC.6